jgi:hypothetical protein
MITAGTRARGRAPKQTEWRDEAAPRRNALADVGGIPTPHHPSRAANRVVGMVSPRILRANSRGPAMDLERPREVVRVVKDASEVVQRGGHVGMIGAELTDQDLPGDFVVLASLVAVSGDVLEAGQVVHEPRIVLVGWHPLIDGQSSQAGRSSVVEPTPQVFDDSKARMGVGGQRVLVAEHTPADRQCLGIVRARSSYRAIRANVDARLISALATSSRTVPGESISSAGWSALEGPAGLCPGESASVTEAGSASVFRSSTARWRLSIQQSTGIDVDWPTSGASARTPARSHPGRCNTRDDTRRRRRNRQARYPAAARR